LELFGVKVEKTVSRGPGECDQCDRPYSEGDTIWPVGDAGQAEWLSIGCSPDCAASLVAQLALVNSQPETL
jgi:hypothetical protein